MKTIELKPREFHRRTAWALQAARKGIPVVILSRNGPPLTLQLGRPGGPPSEAGVDWEEHFAWLRRQPPGKANPVDEVRASEDR